MFSSLLRLSLEAKMQSIARQHLEATRKGCMAEIKQIGRETSRVLNSSLKTISMYNVSAA